MFTHDSSLKRISDSPKEFQLFRACGNTDISGGIGGSIAGGMNGIIGMASTSILRSSQILLKVKFRLIVLQQISRHVPKSAARYPFSCRKPGAA